MFYRLSGSARNEVKKEMKLIGGWRGWNVEVSQEKEEAIKKANEGRKRERNEGR